MAASAARHRAEVKQRVLQGQLGDLPAQDSKVVRIFLSSTFTDYSVERNHLMRTAFPRLRTYCQERGLDFQVVDMRWGVRDEAQNDHQTTELCLREVHNCHRLSRGPYFVGFLGNKYGYRPYPNAIAAEEFEVLLKYVDKSGRDVALLSQWFRRDENAVPPVYVLQPITDHFRFYGDDAPHNAELRDMANRDWNAVNTLLTNLFRSAAARAYQKGAISREQNHQYFMSVTENEFIHGILRHDDSPTRSLCFMRNFTNIDISDKTASRFTDLDAGEPDTEAAELIHELKHEKLPAKLGEDSLHRASVPWLPGVSGLSTTHPEHAAYLKQLEDIFERQVERQIEAATSDPGGRTGNNQVLYQEVLHHSTFCQQKLATFQGRKELLLNIKQALLKVWQDPEVVVDSSGDEDTERPSSGVDEQGDAGGMAAIVDEGSPPAGSSEAIIEDAVKVTKQLGVRVAVEDEEPITDEASSELLQLLPSATCTRPLLIHGPSGCGKTALMAKVMELAPVWLGSEVVRVCRFLGTSGPSTSLRAMLLSLCQQLWASYKVPPPVDLDLARDLTTLQQYLWALVSRLDCHERPLLLVLDSLDQLSPQDGAHGMVWLPDRLPRNVYLIASVLPEVHGCLQTTQQRLQDDSRFIAIPELPVATATDIIRIWCGSAGRALTEPQTNTILRAFEHCPQPLYLKLAFEQGLRWKSYSPEEQWVLGASIQAAIERLFDDTERKHGQILVSKALGYLIASKSGLSGVEMEDILSLDDEVLQDTYLWHLPPEGGVVRLPPLLWRRVHNDLAEYLVERQADNKEVVTWYHRQFVEAARRRYLPGGSGVALHSMLVDYFLGKWANVAKPLELYKKKKGSFPNALRQVPEQPLSFGPGLYNLRMLNELPFQLTRSSRWMDFVTTIARDYTWLEAKVHATSIADVLDDFRFALEAIGRPGYEGGGLVSLPDDEAVLQVTDEETKVMETSRREIQALYDLLIMGSDVIRKNPDAMAPQLLGMLRDSSDLSEGLSVLRARVLAWAGSTRLPLLLPTTRCLPAPGGAIKAVLSVAIGHPGDASSLETKCCLSRDGRYLYAVDRVGKLGDDLKVFDLHDKGQLLRLQQLKGLDVQRIYTLGGDKYFGFEVYERRDTYSPQSHRCVLDQHFRELTLAPEHTSLMTLSPSGTLALCVRTAAEPADGPGAIVVAVSGSQETVMQLPEAAMKIHWALFNHDDSLLVLFTERHFHVLSASSGQLLHTVELADKAHFYSLDTRNVQHFMGTRIMLPGNRLLTPGCSYDNGKNLFLYDLTSGERLVTMEGHSYDIELIALSVDQYRAASATKSTMSASGCGPKNVRIWDLTTGKQVSVCGVEYYRRAGSIYSALAFAGPQDEYLLTSTRLSAPLIQVYHIGDRHASRAVGVPVYELLGHTSDVVYMSVAAGGSLVVSAGTDNTVLLWDAEVIYDHCRHILDTTKDPDGLAEEKARPLDKPHRLSTGMLVTTAMAVSRDGQKAIVGTDHGFVLFYNLEDMSEMRYQQVAEEKVKVSATLTSANGQYFISASSSIHVWSTDTCELLRELEMPKKTNYGSNLPGCLAEGGNRLVGGFAGMECKGIVWDLDTGEQLRVIGGLYGFNCVDVLSDGTKVAGTFFDFPMVYDVDNGEPLNFNMESIDTMMSGCTVLRISHDGRWVAAGSADGGMRVVSLDQGEYRFRFQHHSSVVEAQYSPDSRLLFTAAFRSVLVWSLQDGKLVTSLRFHQAFIKHIRFACEGRFLITGGMDKKIVVYDLVNRVKVTEFLAHCTMEHLAVSADLSSVLFAPVNIAYVASLKPNVSLQGILAGQDLEVPERLQQAQALALAFTPQRATRKTSNLCCTM